MFRSSWLSLIVLIAVLVPGVADADDQALRQLADRYEAERLRAEAQGGHDYSPLELQSEFVEILINPRFKTASEFLMKRGFVLNWAEIEGGGTEQSGESLRLLSIPFDHHSGQRHGFLVVKNDDWRILIASPQGTGEETRFQGFAIENSDGMVVIRSAADIIPAEPDHDLEGLLGKSWKPLTCAYVEKVKTHWACALNDLEGNPFGYQYTVRFREGTYWSARPTRVAWHACWYGSIHTCPVKQTKTYTFPICGIPPRHARGG